MSAGACRACGHPEDVGEVTRLLTNLARLQAQHRRFATETNRIITEQLAEIRRLRDLRPEEVDQ